MKPILRVFPHLLVLSVASAFSVIIGQDEAFALYPNPNSNISVRTAQTSPIPKGSTLSPVSFGLLTVFTIIYIGSISTNSLCQEVQCAKEKEELKEGQTEPKAVPKPKVELGSEPLKSVCPLTQPSLKPKTHSCIRNERCYQYRYFPVLVKAIESNSFFDFSSVLCCKPGLKDFAEPTTGNTALHYAVLYHNSTFKRELLALGAKEVPNLAGKTPSDIEKEIDGCSFDGLWQSA